MTKKTQNIYTVVVAAVLVFGLAFWAVLKPADEFSESERRPLDQLPELSLKTLLNGNFMDKFENQKSFGEPPRRSKYNRLTAQIIKNSIKKAR